MSDEASKEARRRRLLGLPASDEPVATPVAEPTVEPVVEPVAEAAPAPSGQSRRDRLLGLKPEPVVAAKPAPVAAVVRAPTPVVATPAPVRVAPSAHKVAEPVVVVKKAGPKPKPASAPFDGDPAMPWGYYEQIDTGATPEAAQAYVDALPTFGTVGEPGTPTGPVYGPPEREMERAVLPKPTKKEVLAANVPLNPKSPHSFGSLIGGGLLSKGVAAVERQLTPKQTPETLVSRAALQPDKRAAAEKLINDVGLRSAMGVPEDAPLADLGLALVNASDPQYENYYRYRLQKADGRRPDGQKFEDLPKDVADKERAKVREDAMVDLALLKTVGMWGPKGFMPADRDPTSVIDAFKPSAEVIGVNDEGEVVTRVQSLPSYALDVGMGSIEYGIISTGLPSALLRGMFGENPEADQPTYNYGQIAGITVPISPESIRARRDFLGAKQEADVEGSGRRAARSVGEAVGAPAPLVDAAEYVAGKSLNFNVGTSAFVASLLTPDPFTVVAAGAKLAGVPIFLSETEKLVRAEKKAALVAEKSAKESADFGDLIARNASESEVVERIEQGAKVADEMVKPLTQSAKDAVADAARVRVHAEKAAVEAEAAERAGRQGVLYSEEGARRAASDAPDVAAAEPLPVFRSPAATEQRWHRIGDDHQYTELTISPEGALDPSLPRYAKRGRMSSGRGTGFASGMYAFADARQGTVPVLPARNPLTLRSWGLEVPNAAGEFQRDASSLLFLAERLRDLSPAKRAEAIDLLRARVSSSFEEVYDAEKRLASPEFGIGRSVFGGEPKFPSDLATALHPLLSRWRGVGVRAGLDGAGTVDALIDAAATWGKHQHVHPVNILLSRMGHDGIEWAGGALKEGNTGAHGFVKFPPITADGALVDVVPDPRHGYAVTHGGRDPRVLFSEEGAGARSAASDAPDVAAPIVLRNKGERAGAEGIDRLSAPDKLYRGMTEAEYVATVGKDGHVRSRQDYSVPGEGTSFSDSFADAESYVDFGRDDPRITGRPNYIVEVDRGELSPSSDGYFKAPAPVPAGRVWKVVAEDDALVGRPIQSRAAATGNVGTWNPNDPRHLYQTVSVRKGEETLAKFGLPPRKKKYTTREVAAALEARQRKKYGLIDAKDQSPTARRKIAKWMAEEVAFEKAQAGRSGAGWYSEKYQKAMDSMAEEFPELANDLDAKTIFTALVAVTSDGNKVMPNMRMAADIYDNFRKTGKFSTPIGHVRQASIDKSLAVIQELHDSGGPPAFRRLLDEITVGEYNKLARATKKKEIAGELVNARIPTAASLFGPKLGAFYANLMGADGYLTMDRWWSRTFNRYRGTLLERPTREGLDRMKALLGDPSMTDDAVLSATVPLRKSYEAKEFKNGTEAEVAANTVWKAAFDELADAPTGGSDRKFMREAAKEAQAILKKQGMPTSVADIQAILWYYEKRLYGELGARETADIAFDEAARRVVAERRGRAGSSGRALGPDGSAAGDDVAEGVGDVHTFDPGDDLFEVVGTAAPIKVGYRGKTIGEAEDAIEATFATRAEAEAAVKEGGPLEGFEVWADWTPTPGRTTDALAGVVADGGDEALSAVAKHLIETRGDDLAGVVVRTDADLPSQAVGRYNPAAKVIDLAGTATPKTVVHEAMHVVAHDAITNPHLYSPAVQKAVRNLEQLHGLVRRIPGIEDMGRIYGLKNTDEFVAEAMSSPEFQALLREVKVTVKDGEIVLGTGGGSSRSLWDSFVSTMAKILGFSDTDALGHVLSNTQTIIRETGGAKTVILAADTSPWATKIREAALAVKAKSPTTDFAWLVEHPSVGGATKEVEAYKAALAEAGMDPRVVPDIEGVVGPGAADAVYSRASVEVAGATPGEEAAAAKAWREMGVDSPWFKRWFGGSKIVNAEGKPLVVGHVSQSTFDVFNTLPSEGALGSHFAPRENLKAIDSAFFGGEDGVTYTPVYLAIKNPLHISDGENTASGILSRIFGSKASDLPSMREAAAKLEKTPDGARLAEMYDAGDLDPYLYEANRTASDFPDEPREIKEAFVRAMNDAGYDGLVYKNKGVLEGGGTSYVAFSPEQIKSATANRGTFSKDPRFLYAPPSAPAPSAAIGIADIQREFGIGFNDAHALREEWKKAQAGVAGVATDPRFAVITDLAKARAAAAAKAAAATPPSTPTGAARHGAAPPPRPPPPPPSGPPGSPPGSPPRPVQYSATPMRGSLDGAIKAEQKARVHRASSQHAALGLSEGLRNVARLATSVGGKPAVLTPAEAAAYAERLFDSASTTARELALGAQEAIAPAGSKGAIRALVESVMAAPPTPATQALVSAVEAADAARRMFTGERLEKALRAVTPRVDKAFRDVMQAGVAVTPAQRAAFRDAAVLELEGTLIGKNSLARAEAAIDKVLATAPVDQITPQMMGDVDEVMRTYVTEAAEATRRANPLRSSAPSILLGESASRFRGVKDNPTLWGALKNGLVRSVKLVFVGGNEMAPWAKEGLSKEAREWTLAAVRRFDAIAGDVSQLKSADEAAAYLHGVAAPANRGLVTDGMDRFDVFTNLVTVDRKSVDEYLDALMATEMKPKNLAEQINGAGVAGRPEQGGAQYPFWMEVQAALEAARAGKIDAAGFMERLHKVAKPYTRNGEVPEAWTRVTTGWIAAQAENVVLLNKGFGDGIVFTKQDVDAIRALGTGQFDEKTMRALDPANMVERAVSSNRMVGVGGLEGRTEKVGELTVQIGGADAVAGVRKHARAAERIGVYNAVMADQIYVPRLVREQMAGAIARTFTPQTYGGNNMLGVWKLANTRGVLASKPGYILNNMPGDTEEIMVATGMRIALKTAVRAEGASVASILVTALPSMAGHAARAAVGDVAGPVVQSVVQGGVDFGLGVFLAATAGKNKGAVARLIHAGGEVGEKLAGKVANMLGMGATRVEISTIMDGGDELVTIGDKVWKARELRRTAIETGVYDSFDRAELVQSVNGLNKLFRVPAEGVSSIAETVSLRKRLALYTVLIEEGMQPKAAGRAVVDALFDYRATLSEGEKHWLRQVLLPFWSWQKNMNRLVINSVASPMGAYRLKVTHQVGEKAKEMMAEAPTTEGDDVGILNTFMLADEVVHYERFRRFRELAEAINPQITPENWNAIILSSNPGVPVTTEWTHDPTIPEADWLTPRDVEVMRAYLSPWYTESMARSYLRDRAQVRMKHTVTTDGKVVPTETWHAVAPPSGLAGAMEWFSMVTAGTLAAGALGIKTVGGPGDWLSMQTPGEALSPLIDPKNAPQLGSLIAVMDSRGRSPQRVAEVIPKTVDAIRDSVAGFLLRSGVADGNWDNATPGVLIDDKSGTVHYTYTPEIAALIGSLPGIADLNRKALSYEGSKGEAYAPDVARILLQSFGFSAPTVENMAGLKEVSERNAWVKKHLPQYIISRGDDGERLITTEAAPK